MADIAYTLTDAGRAALVAAGTNGTLPVHIVSCGVSPTALVPSTSLTSLPGEIKRISTVAGTATSGDTIHLTIQDDSADAYDLKSLALYLTDGTMFAVYGQSTSILSKSSASILLMAADIKFASIPATSIAFGNTDFLNPAATETVQGVAEIATQAETDAGTDDVRFVTPKKLWAVLSKFAALTGAAFTGLVKITVAGRGLFTVGAGVGGYQGVSLQHTGVNGSTYGVGYYDFLNEAGIVTGHMFQGYNADGSTFIRFGLTPAGSRTTDRRVDTLSVNTTAAYYAGNLMWHAGNDGAGSGLDADLFDGQDSSYFLNIPARLGYMPFNRAGDTMTGVFNSAGSVTGNNGIGTSASDLGSIMVFGNGTGAAMMTFHRPSQFAAYFGVDVDNRWKVGGWSMGANAYEIWHAGNDGAGSGSDADLLDGQQGSWYADILARLGWTPIQQGGGVGQLGNKLYFGWSGSRMKAQVDWSDLGNIVFDQHISDVWRVSNDGSGSGMDTDLWRGQTPDQFIANCFSSDSGSNWAWDKRPDGRGGFILEQSGALQGSYNSEQTLAVTFPVAFSAAPSIADISVSCGLNNSTSVGDLGAQFLVNSVTRFGFTIQLQSYYSGASPHLDAVSWQVKGRA